MWADGNGLVHVLRMEKRSLTITKKYDRNLLVGCLLWCVGADVLVLLVASSWCDHLMASAMWLSNSPGGRAAVDPGAIDVA